MRPGVNLNVGEPAGFVRKALPTRLTLPTSAIITGRFLRMRVVWSSLDCQLLALLVAFLGLLHGPVVAEPAAGDSNLVDPLDGQPLGWRLSEADTAVEMRAHWLDASGGEQRRPCEAVTVAAGHGTRVLLEYRLEPCLVLDEVRA